MLITFELNCDRSNLITIFFQFTIFRTNNVKKLPPWLKQNRFETKKKRNNTTNSIQNIQKANRTKQQLQNQPIK